MGSFPDIKKGVRKHVKNKKIICFFELKPLLRQLQEVVLSVSVSVITVSSELSIRIILEMILDA